MQIIDIGVFVIDFPNILTSCFDALLSRGGTELIWVLAAAFAIDIVVGEPPAAVHPVVWFGRMIAYLKKKAPQTHRGRYGVFMSLCTVGFAGALALIVLLATNLDFVPAAVRILIQAYFLKATFAVRCMVTPARDICRTLEGTDDIEKVRSEMKTYVSRDTSTLRRSQIISGVVESVSENYVDSILSPIAFYIFFGPLGLVAAYVFKGFSTLDSMIGYMNDEYRELGRFAAKSDDVLNWIPARLSPILLAAGGIVADLMPIRKVIKGFKPGKGISAAVAENKKTPSPNSGWPMAAAAAMMGVRLEKPGVYVLNENGREPETADIGKVSVLIVAASVLTIVAGIAAIAAIGSLRNLL